MSGASLICFLTVAPPAYPHGLPDADRDDLTLARLGKEHMFLWAWGINGCFSVLGAAAVPLIATGFGLSSVLAVGGSRLSRRDPGLLRRRPADPRPRPSGRSNRDGTVKGLITITDDGRRRERAVNIPPRGTRGRMSCGFERPSSDLASQRRPCRSF